MGPWWSFNDSKRFQTNHQHILHITYDSTISDLILTELTSLLYWGRMKIHDWNVKTSSAYRKVYRLAHFWLTIVLWMVLDVWQLVIVLTEARATETKKIPILSILFHHYTDIRLLLLLLFWNKFTVPGTF